MQKLSLRYPLCLTALGFVVLGLSACGSGGWFGEPEKPPLAGERKAAFDYERTLRPDADSKATSFKADAQQQNSEWSQAGGNASHAMGSLTLSSAALRKAWSADIGTGSRTRLPLTAQPVVMGESIFTLDTDSNLSSFDTATGKNRWNVNVRSETEDEDVISGGIAGANGFLYVTAGYNEVLCVDAVKGDIKWRVKTQSPSRAAPTVLDGRVYVTSLSNSILSLNAADGRTLWEFSGLETQTGLVGAASPAVYGDLVIPAFSSGEIYALRTANGSVAWSDNLSGSLRLGGLGALSDIRALPVVRGNVAYAISFAGKMAAIDMASGTRLWQKDISGSKTPWVSGNRIFLISSEEQIISLDSASGAVLWVSQLARYKDKKSKTGQIFWTGPVLAGERLIALSSDGRLAEIDPQQGTLVRESRIGEDVRIPPIVAGGTLYILSEDGALIAYR